MTELERIFKETLTTMERELIATQEVYKTRLEAHDNAIQRLQQSVKQLQAQQLESARHLQHLSDIHANLEPLLSRLNDILNGR